MKIFLEDLEKNGESLVHFANPEVDGIRIYDLDVPAEAEEVIRSFLKFQELLEDLTDKKVSLHILVNECIKLGVRLSSSS